VDQSLEEVFASAFERIREDGWIAQSEFYSTLDSTNDFLKRTAEADSDASLPRLVVAQHQTAGRGRGQNRWWSPSGVLTFSVLVSSPLHEGIHDRLPQLSLVTAIAVANALDNILSVPSQLKWPNDVYVHERKICGILVESILRNKSVRTVIGIGINVDVDLLSAPDEIRERATSMHLHATTRPKVEEVLVQVIQNLSSSIDRWQNDKNYLTTNFQSRCYLQNKFVEVDSNGTTIRGLCNGINETGELMVQDESGRQKVIRAGVIRLIQTN
jgi:BirA family transcriptional regulator, biotin operon repressor / biotin---[acetyl-CoA-carboxylase] ligase